MKIDFKWVGIGTIIIIVLAYVSLIVGAVAGSLAVSYLLIFLSYFAGGIIIGKKSPGKTIIEPGIASAIASLFPGISGLGILISFLMGVAGGYVGEKWQGSQVGEKVSSPAPVAQTRFCPECGTPAETNSGFCSNCGTRLKK